MRHPCVPYALLCLTLSLSLTRPRTHVRTRSRLPPLPPPKDDELKILALAVALKCADLGNLAAPHAVHKRWVAQLEEEYFQQVRVRVCVGKGGRTAWCARLAGVQARVGGHSRAAACVCVAMDGPPSHAPPARARRAAAPPARRATASA